MFTSEGRSVDVGRQDPTRWTDREDALLNRPAGDEATADVARRLQARLDRHLWLLDRWGMEQSHHDTPGLPELLETSRRMWRDTESLLLLLGQDPGAQVTDPRRLTDLLADATSAVDDPYRVDVRSAPAATVVPAAATEFLHVLAELIDDVAAVYPEARLDIASRIEARGIVVDVSVDAGPRYHLDGLDIRPVALVAEQLAERSFHRITLRRSPTGPPPDGPALVASVHCPAAAVTVDEPAPGLDGPLPSRNGNGNGNGSVFPDGPVFDDGPLFGNGPVFDDGPAFDSGPVFGDGPLFDNGPVLGNGLAPGDGGLFGDRAAPENGSVFGNRAAPEHGSLFGNRPPSDNGWIFGDAPASDDAWSLAGGPERDNRSAVHNGSAPDARSALDDGLGGGSGPADGAGQRSDDSGYPGFGSDWMGNGFDPLGRSADGPAAPDGPPAPAFAPSGSGSAQVDELFGPLLDLPLEPMDERFATPIFEAIASAWFRDPDAPSDSDEPGPSGAGPVDWETPNDSEWRAAAARAAHIEPEPVTSSGLPRRRPGNQLVPPPRVQLSTPAGERVPDRVRERLATYQRGLNQGRHRAPGAGESEAG